MDSFVATRTRELEERADREGVEWRGRVGELPEDPRIRLAALATALGIDAIDVLDERRSVPEIEEARRALVEDAEREMQQTLPDLRPEG